MSAGLITFAVRFFVGLAGLALKLLDQRICDRRPATQRATHDTSAGVAPEVDVYNHIAAHGDGHMVQAHTIHGDVIFYGTALPSAQDAGEVKHRPMEGEFHRKRQ